MPTLPNCLDDPDYVPDVDEFDPERDAIEGDDHERE